MDIQNYYQIVRIKIENGDFVIKSWNEDLIQEKGIMFLEEQSKSNSHLETIHYLMYEFWADRKDSRIDKVFDYVCMPSGVNEGNTDIDFTKWETEHFIEEIMKLKD